MINLIKEDEQPIYIVGLPRSGTSWLASVLNTAWGIKYFYEPFNKDQVVEAKPYWMKYIRADDDEPEFALFCRDAFAGRVNKRPVTRKLSTPYSLVRGRLRWLPGRVMVKDVHTCMSLEWIDRHIKPFTIIIIRHPCALISSWFRIFKSTVKQRSANELQKLISQPRLIEDYLKPFEHLFQQDGDFWQQTALYWAAVYYVILEQKKHHPDWIVVQHEHLCQEPIKEYKQLFDKLDLRWTRRTDKLLKVSTTEDSGRAYLPKRISSQEPDKWKKELESWQVDRVRRSIKPFGIPYYSDF